MKKISIENYEFLGFHSHDAHIIFSTSENELDFNKETDKGVLNLENLKEWFSLEKVGFLNQIHSDSVFIYDGKAKAGDGLITKERKVAIGVFTADCVPILIYNNKKEVISAVHSGWRGTYEGVLSKTLNMMSSLYDCDHEYTEIYIGPHNMDCCYEVGQELVDKFLQKDEYKDINIFNGRNLSLQKCIIKQALISDIKGENINTLDICTYCNKNHKMHSYRKHKESAGRMFSFIYFDR